MKPRYLLPGQLPDGSWESPTDLRCLGGPADGLRFAKPPYGYMELELRGGSVWHWMDDLWPPSAMPGEAA